MVADLAASGASAAARWHRVEAIISSPILPTDLKP